MSEPDPIGIVCGSGINLDLLLDTHTEIIPFSNCPELPETTVTGHQGQFIKGTCRGIPVIVQCGRLHLYEGLSYETTTLPVNIMHQMGIQTILFTNAAGGLNPNMKPGDLLAAKSLAIWPSKKWIDHPSSVSTDFLLQGCDHIGTYTWIHGPSYETQAEIHALQSIQSDAVGMSTAPEIDRCKKLGIRAASISCITNNCCSPQTLTHEHVIQIAAKASERICEIIRASMPDLAV